MERRGECRTDTQHLVNMSAYAWALRRLESPRESRVLDAACGTGVGSYRLAERVSRAVGVDVSSGAVAGAAKRYHRPNLSYAVMDGSRLGFRDASFDVVTSFETVEHIPGDRQFVEEIARVLRPGGWLFLSTPRAALAGTTPEDPYHVREYTWNQLATLLSTQFTSIVRYGRRLGPRLARLEHDLDRVRRVVPASARRLLPRRVRHLLGTMVSKAHGGARLDEVTVKDVEYVEGLEDTATLLAICQRR